MVELIFGLVVTVLLLCGCAIYGIALTRDLFQFELADIDPSDFEQPRRVVPSDILGLDNDGNTALSGGLGQPAPPASWLWMQPQGAQGP